MALTLEPKSRKLYAPKMIKASEPLITASMRMIMIFVSLVSSTVILGSYFVALRIGHELIHAQTLAFTILTFSSLAYVFSCRSMTSILKSNLFENMWLVGAVLLGAAFQLLAIYHPFLQNILGTVGLNKFDWGIVAVSSLLVVACIEGFKVIVLYGKRA
jgi:Ca2+-transporting ATPase